MPANWFMPFWEWYYAQPSGRMIEYAVIGGYLITLVAVALVFKHFNSNVSDYFRNGCRGTWWLVGMSAFMASFSAWTFTGAAGVAFENGWSIMIIFIGNTLALLLNAAFLAPWFRQLRAISAPEVIRMRFGISTQQFYAWLTFSTYFIGAALQLYALAAFCSAVFNYPVGGVIVFIGCVVLFYSLLGGSWAVMATDFIQSLILIPMTVLVAVLCLREVGGISMFFNLIHEHGLTEQFQLVKPVDPKKFIDYSWIWIIGMWLNQSLGQNAIGAAPRYFAVKDGKAARKAALIAAFFMAMGCFIWFIPPMTARLLYAEAVDAVSLAHPADASYAIASMKVLPTGLTGLMVVAMFAATMSAMDTGLNRNAAVFTNDIYPALCRLFRREPKEGKSLLFLSQIFTLFLGAIVITVAYKMSQARRLSIFEIMQLIGAVLGSVLVIPLFMGLFVKRAPWWAAIVAIFCAAVPSYMGFVSGKADYWTWAHGPQDVNGAAVYSKLGKLDEVAIPGARYSAASWTDSSGDLWLFGGQGRAAPESDKEGLLNDLWRYNRKKGRWAWEGGAQTINQIGRVEPGEERDQGATPSARANAVAWGGGADTLWLFGGRGVDDGGETRELGDLWTFDTDKSEWHRVRAATDGQAPGPRDDAVSWGGTAETTHSLWLFGGRTADAQGDETLLGDLWRYDAVADDWTLLTDAQLASGDRPAARRGAVAWFDEVGSGTLWLFGGLGADESCLNDLWRYDVTSSTWACVRASVPPAFGPLRDESRSYAPGGRVGAVSWLEGSGDKAVLWVFGGYGIGGDGEKGDLNDLWRYSVASGAWSVAKGDSMPDALGFYGSLKQPYPDNAPPARRDAAAWGIGSGTFVMFGGRRPGEDGKQVLLQEMWQYRPATPPRLASALPFLEYRWPWYMRVFLNLGIGALAFLVCTVFWGSASQRYRSQVDDFFRIMRKPVDFAKEVGAGTDLSQLKIVGAFCASIGLAICLLLFIPNDAVGRWSIAFIGGSVGFVGGALYLFGAHQEEEDAAKPDFETSGD